MTEPGASLRTEPGEARVPARIAGLVADVAAELAAAAAEVDETRSIPRSHRELLAASGLYGATAPTALGGLGLGAPELSGVIEALAAACLATTLVWIQHFRLLGLCLDPAAPGPLRALSRPLTRGELTAGVALAGILSGEPTLRAGRRDGAWELDGKSAWVSGWGQVDLLAVAARSPGGHVASFVLDATEQAGLSATRLRLAAIDASATVRLSFDRLAPGPDRFAGERTYDPAREQHEGLRSNGSLALGVARRCCGLLGPGPLDGELAAARAELDAAGVAAMPAARARASELANRAAHALAVARGSRSALAGDVAERSQREAALLLVFATRPAIRSSLLDRLGAAVAGRQQ